MDSSAGRSSSRLSLRPSIRHMVHPGLILLPLALWCCGATESWAAGTDQPPSAATYLSVPTPKSAPGAPSAATVADPCAPSAPIAQTRTPTTEPSGDPTAAWANLLTRAKGRERPASTEAKRGDSLTLELWSSRISAPDSREDVETSLALKRLIRQVHRLTFNGNSSTPASGPSSEAAPTPEPPVPSVGTEEGAPPAHPEVVAGPTPEAASTLPPKAQKALADLQRNPSRMRDPLETAELLFLSGRPADAAPFYEEALRRASPGTAAAGNDRAWILFQLGNCLRETEATKAQEAYAKLIVEYPDSPWTEIARAGGRLLTWYRNTQPEQLMAPAR